MKYKIFVKPEIALLFKERGMQAHDLHHKDFGWLLYDEALAWLMENHIHINFAPRSWTVKDGVHIIKWSFWADALDIWMCNLSIDDRHTDDPYDNYDEAREKALLGAIELFDKLPEIREKLKSL
jgi:hypothetical protein